MAGQVHATARFKSKLLCSQIQVLQGSVAGSHPSQPRTNVVSVSNCSHTSRMTTRLVGTMHEEAHKRCNDALRLF